MKDTNVPNIERAIKKVWTPVKRRVSRNPLRRSHPGTGELERL